MKVTVARLGGFCAGVRRAVEAAGAAVAEHGRVRTLGPLIHNRQVVEELRQQGVVPATSLDEISDVLLVPSHGLPQQTVAEAERRGLRVIDLTCPLVKRIQCLTAELAESGYLVVLVGDREHSEVKAILGAAPGQAMVVSGPAEAQAVPAGRLALLAQTTQSPENVAAVAHILRERDPGLRVEDTLCSMTSDRQAEVAAMAREVDMVLVVGGRESANTARLASVARAAGVPAYHIESAAELKADWFKGMDRVGITAGTSTPDWIIEEVIAKVTDMEDKDLDQSPKSPAEGQTVRGRVVKVAEDVVLVDIGDKAEGRIETSELPRSGGELLWPEVGAEVDVLVLRTTDEGAVLSLKQAGEEAAWRRLEAALANGETLTAPITAAVKGGLVADVGIRGFVPASQAGLGFVEDLKQFEGRELALKVIEVDRAQQRAILSHRAVLEEERARQREQAWAELAEGQVRKGVVRRLSDFGAFVDLGGLDGLVHVSELAWGRVEKPADVVQPGQEVDVYVLKVDKERQRVSLSIRRTLPDPWNEAAAKFSEGQVAKGKVTRLAPFGAFVELAPGVEGLVHISQLADRRVAKPDEVVSPGQEVQVKIIGVRPQDKRISLSIREVEADREQDTYRDYLASQQATEGVTIGDLIKKQEDKRKDEQR